MNGPRRATPFLDRFDQRQTIRDRLALCSRQRQPTLVVIHGASGYGSYSLAAETSVERLESVGGPYIEIRASQPDGSPIPLGELLGQALTGLGLTDLDATDDARATSYQRLSAGRAFVLLIKDAVSVEQIRPLIPVGAPDALVMVTSRNALRRLYADDFVGVKLDRLPPEEARQLLVSSLGATAAEIDDALIGELDALCDGHPLLIRLVAAHLLGRARVAASLVTRVRQSRAALLDLDVTRPVTAALTLTYRGLRDPLREVFWLASLVPGPDFGPVPVAIAGGTEVLAAEEMLDDLVDANLVTVAGRYAIPSVFREFARLRARESGRADAAVTKIVRWYLREAVRHDAALSARWRVGSVFAVTGPTVSRDEALDWFGQEWRTVVACVGAARDVGEHDVAWQLCVAVFKYLHLHGHTDAWLESHRLGLESARLRDPAAVMQLTNQRGAAWMALGDLDRAGQDFTESLALAEQLDHAQGRQSNLEWLGKVAAKKKDFVEAHARYDASEAAIDLPGIPDGQKGRMRALVNLNRARALFAEGRRTPAVAAVTLALEYFRATDERENTAKCLRVRGEASGSAPDCHEAAELFRADGLRRAEADALDLAATLDSDPERARAARERAADLYAELGDPREDRLRDELGEG